MDILIGNIVLLLVEGFMVQKSIKGSRKFYCIIIFIQLFFLHAFLDPFKMVDLPGYIDTFEKISANSLTYSLSVGYVGVKLEMGWIIFCKLLSYVSDNYHILLIATSLIIVGSYCRTIYKYSPIVWLSAFVYVCTLYCQSLYVLRQHMAMAVCLFSISFIVKHQWLKSIFLYLLAISLHKTALIFGLVFILYNFKIDRKFLFWYVIATLIVGGISTILFNWLFEHTWYNSYSEKEGSNYTMFLISLCVLLLYCSSISWKTASVSSYEKFFLIMGLLALSCSIVGAGFSPTNRLVKYFTLSSVFLVPMGINRLKEPWIKVLATIAVLTFFLLFFFAPSNINYIEDYTLLV